MSADGSGKLGGNSPGRRRNGDKNMWPGRPADAPEPRRAAKIPPGVEGHSLGGGAARALRALFGRKK